MAEGSRWALLIGINEYEREDVTPLKYAVQDVHCLASALKGACGFPDAQVLVLTSDSPSERPTRGNIARRFSYLAQRMGEEDTFLFFFAGHGMFNPTVQESYLLTHEADTYSDRTLRETCLPVERVREWLSDLPARNILALYDACRNEPLKGRHLGDNLMADALARDLGRVRHRTVPRPRTGGPEASATFYACKVGQRSFEWPAQAGGFFTHFLIRGLQGDAASANGEVTLNSLESYLAKQVPDATLKELNVRQQPWVAREGSGAGELVLARHPVAPSGSQTVAAGTPAPSGGVPSSPTPSAPVRISTISTLVIRSEPTGAEVFLDRQPLGVTPLEASLDLGVEASRAVEVVLRSPGRQTEAAIIQLVRGGKAEWLDAVLAPLPAEPPQRGKDLSVSLKLQHAESVAGCVHEVTTSQGSVAVAVPPGASDGQWLRLAGKGGAGAHGGEAGDLLVLLQVAPAPERGLDARQTLVITWEQAARGCTRMVPIEGGTVAVAVPSGAVQGQQLIVKDAGRPGRHGGPRGDLLVTLQVAPQPAASGSSAPTVTPPVDTARPRAAAVPQTAGATSGRDAPVSAGRAAVESANRTQIGTAGAPPSQADGTTRAGRSWVKWAATVSVIAVGAIVGAQMLRAPARSPGGPAPAGTSASGRPATPTVPNGVRKLTTEARGILAGYDAQAAPKMPRAQRDRLERSLRAAEEACRRAMKLAPDYPDSYLTLTEILFRLGRKHGDWRQASDAAIERFPADSRFKTQREELSAAGG
jgi:uncharacterized caspase-like protein